MTAEPLPVRLRPVTPHDLPFLAGGESPFDDFGPAAAPSSPRTPSLDDDGALVVEDADGAVAGMVSWRWGQWGPNAGSRCPMIGISLRPAFRGRGLGTAAQRALADLFFRHTTTHRVEANTDVENVAEQRALEKAGFTREGVLRGSQWRDGAYHDSAHYAVLRTDPRE